MEKAQVVIIGGGPGGYVAAIRAAQLGASVILVEKSKLGGTCLNRGCIPTKCLLASTHVLDVTKQAEEFGVEVDGIKPNLSRMMERKKQVVAELRQGIRQLLKANKIKFELRDGIEMVYLIQTLKDIADNKYFSLLNGKDKFRRFTDTFAEFFRMLRQTSTINPLVENDNPVTCIVVVTVEGSFLGEFNNKVVRLALKEMENHSEVRFLAVGNRSVDQLKKYTPDIKVYEKIENYGFYETAVELKDYLLEEIFNGRIGKVVVCYTWPKKFEVLKS